MISKQQIKLIHSLANKKYRNKYGKFVAEGAKIAEEIIKTKVNPSKVFATENWVTENQLLLNAFPLIKPEIITPQEMKSISNLSTPSEILLVLDIPDNKTFNSDDHIVIALDAIRDPGNLGTIIRIADWYGLNQILCSEDCVDVWNAKVVQASMGSILRVNCLYVDLKEYLQGLNMPIYASKLDGELNIHQLKKIGKAVLVIGNESVGISDAITSIANYTISIPRYGSAESLNAAIATGILLDNFIRNSHTE